MGGYTDGSQSSRLTERQFMSRCNVDNMANVVKVSDMSETEEKLIHSAIRSFVRFGVRKTTMSDIAEEAGVSRQTLYTFFRSRDDILAASIRHASSKQLAAAMAKWDRLETLGDKLDAYFDEVVVAAYELIKNAPDAEYMITGYNEAGRAVIHEVHAERSEAIAEILAPYEKRIVGSGRSVAQLAHFIVVTAVGFKYLAESKNDLLDLLSSLKIAMLVTAGEASS